MSDIKDEPPTGTETPTETPTEASQRKLKLVQSEKRIVGSSMHDMISPAQSAIVSYDGKQARDFIELIMHAGDDEDEVLPMWALKPHSVSMGYPHSEYDMFESVYDKEGLETPLQCYFSTSTIKRNANGALRAKNDNFISLRVIVLDDIGTKVPVSKLPKKLKPTYIIETSEGNFQYGYVLETPVTDLEPAKMLVQLAYESGFGDSGGKLPVKLVRMPAGVNGKSGDKGAFAVKLIHMTGPKWDVQDLLNALNTQQDWKAIEKDALDVAKRRAMVVTGASVWSHAKMPSTNGTVDPVLEWMIENDAYLSDNGEWVSTPCPNAAAHTVGDGSAGYRPLGRGSDPTSRAFHCMHGHCTDVKTPQFLAYIAANNGPRAAVRDTAAALTSTFIYDQSDDLVWQIRDCQSPLPMSTKSFEHVHPKLTYVTGPDGTQKAVAEHRLWKDSDSRVNVIGRVFDPSTPARIVKSTGQLRVNMYCAPTWGYGSYTQSEVDKFTDFMEYLIPKESEREFFLDWLAAKAQNMAFRGPAVLMIAPKQGTGRTTMSDMIKTLFAVDNVLNVPFKDMVSDSGFNEWMEAPIVVTDETLNTSGENHYHTYEKIKEMIDPRPKMTTINPKYGKKRVVMVYSSFIFFSNHVEALAIDSNDRRFAVLDNVYTPASPEYFTELNAWLEQTNSDGQPEWAAHVWRWLQSRKFDMVKLLAPPENTAAKQRMLEGSKSPLALAVEAILAASPTPNISLKMVESIMAQFSDRLGLAENGKWKAVVKHQLKEWTHNYDSSVTVTLKRSSVRPRFIASWGAEAADTSPQNMVNRTPNKKQRAQISHDTKTTELSLDEMQVKVSASLDLLDL